jgi:hypothetical protein
MMNWKRPFFSYQNFWPCDLDLEVWPSFEKKSIWTLSFEPNVLELWNLRYRCFMKTPFFSTNILNFGLFPGHTSRRAMLFTCLLTTLVKMIHKYKDFIHNVFIVGYQISLSNTKFFKFTSQNLLCYVMLTNYLHFVFSKW